VVRHAPNGSAGPHARAIAAFAQKLAVSKCVCATAASRPGGNSAASFAAVSAKIFRD